jgi:hypothetical protein
MTGEAPHPTEPRSGAGAFVQRLLIGLQILVAGFAAAFVLPALTVLTATSERGGASWPVYVWVPFVFLASIWSVIVGIQALDDPRFRQIALLLGVALVAFFSFPPFWFAES